MDNEEKKIKNIKLIVFGIFAAIVLLLGFLIYNNLIKNKTSNKYLIAGNYMILQKTNSGFVQIDEISDDMLKLKYDISDGNIVKNDVTLQYVDNNWYFFDKDYNEIDMSDFRVAAHKFKFSLADIKRETVQISSDDYVNDFFDRLGIFVKDSYKGFRIISDFDKDGEDEYIYTINNYSLTETGYIPAGYIFAVDNDKLIYDENTGKGMYTVMDVMDLDNDGNYEIIVNKGNIDLKTFDSCYQFYNYESDKLKLKKDCK